jgi:hypothetical protein
MTTVPVGIPGAITVTTGEVTQIRLQIDIVNISLTVLLVGYATAIAH